MSQPRSAPRKAKVDLIQTALERLAEIQEETHVELRELALAQRRTEERVEQLAEAQRRTEERLDALAQRVDALTQRVDALAQRVDALTQRVDALAQRVDALAQRVNDLAEAQRRTEERVEQLAEAQRRTEEAVQVLAREVGRLGEIIGFTLEDLARDLTPDRLARRYGISVPALERAFFQVDGQQVELDFFGVGQRDSETIVIVGEAKSRIHARDVEGLSERARQLAPQLSGTPIPVLFGFVIHPSAKDAADRLGAIVIASGG